MRQGERALERLGGGSRLSALAPHPTIDASTRGRGRIAHRSVELGHSRTAVGVVWITDVQCPFMPAKASPNHKLDALVNHEVGSGCCGTDVAAGSTQTRRQRYRRTGKSSASDRDGKPRFRVTTSPSFVSALTAYSIFSHCCLKFPGVSRKFTVCRMERI